MHHKYFCISGFTWTDYESEWAMVQNVNCPSPHIGFTPKTVLHNTEPPMKKCFAGFTQVQWLLKKTEANFVFVLPKLAWIWGVGQLNVWHKRVCLNDGKDHCCTKPLNSWHSSSVLLSHLLDVNSISGKHIHKLRVLSTLLITMAKTEIRVVSPCEHFSWVCMKYEEKKKTLSHHINDFAFEWTYKR